MTKKKNQNNKKQQASIAKIAGQGNYVVDVAKKIVPDGFFTQMGTKAGGALAPLVSSNPYVLRLGKDLGGKLGGAISRLVGFGDYHVVNNTLTTVGKAIDPGQAVPSFGDLSMATRIRHREYIGDIITPSTPATFTLLAYPINPGMPQTFPWLSTLANQYQQYIFNGLVFEFVSTSSEYATGTAMGSIILATDYDSLDSNFIDKPHMENCQYSVSAKPSMNQIHTIECLPSATANKLYYTRNGATNQSGDLRLYDLGNFQVATSGLTAPAGAVLGELWVSFDISLFKPIVGLFTGNSQKITAGGTINVTNAWGSSPTSVGALYFLPLAAGQLICQVSGSYIMTHVAICTTPSIPIYGGSGAVGISGYGTSQPLASTTTFLQEVGVTCTVGQNINVDISLWGSNAGWTTRIAPYNRALA